MSNSPWSTLIFFALIIAVFYLLILRPQRKRQLAAQRTLSELTPGSRVMLTSGLFGTVVEVGSKQIVLEISPGTELTVLKQAVARIATAADEDGPDDDVPDSLSTAEPGTLSDPAPTSIEDLPRGTDPEPRPGDTRPIKE